MAFDLSSAMPVDQPKRGGFDLASAKPVDTAPAPEDDSLSGRVKALPGAMREAVGSVAEPLMAMGSGAFAKPVSDIAGLATLPAAMTGLTDRDPQTVKEGVQRAFTYEPRTQAGRAVTEYNPLALLGKGIGWGAEKLSQIGAPPKPEQGPLESALRGGVREAGTMAPMFAGVKAPAAAGAASRGLRTLAEDTMQSALKPPLAAQKTGKAASAIDTLLDEGINVTRGGMEKLQSRIEALNNAIFQRIADSPATVNKGAVASRLTDSLERFTKQVTPLSDVRAIQSAWDEFMQHPLLQDEIPVKTAQELKQGTYRSLGDKAYGELKGADIEAQKALARGLKEEIAKAVPQVRQLNAEESKLLNALTLVERRVLMSANKNPVGLGWLTSNPAKFAAWMADRSEIFKSLIARMLNTGSRATPSLETAGPLMGIAVSEQANQIPPPPQ